MMAVVVLMLLMIMMATLMMGMMILTMNYGAQALHVHGPLCIEQP